MLDPQVISEPHGMPEKPTAPSRPINSAIRELTTHNLRVRVQPPDPLEALIVVGHDSAGNVLQGTRSETRYV